MDKPSIIVVQERKVTRSSIHTFCEVMVAAILCMHAITTYKDFKKKIKGE